MFKYVRVQLNRSETTVITADIAPWELPVFAAVNGEDRVVVGMRDQQQNFDLLAHGAVVNP